MTYFGAILIELKENYINKNNHNKLIIVANNYSIKQHFHNLSTNPTSNNCWTLTNKKPIKDMNF